MSNNFEAMLAAQRALQINSFGNNPGELSQEEAVEFIRWNTLAATDELHEALAEVGWKPWATSKHINREAFISELVDAFHFYMNLMLVVNCSVEEFTEAYFKKRSINEQRQAEGYDGVAGKCHRCKRALDDPAVLCDAIVCILQRD